MSHRVRRSVTAARPGTPAFLVTNRATWPDVLSLAQVAQIYNTTPNAIQHQVKPSSSVVSRVPHPFMKYPLRWRKADVVRHLDGGRRVA